MIERTEKLNDHLRDFRARIAGGHLDSKHYAYSLKKPRVMVYKFIFCLIGAVLIALSATVFLRTPNWVLELYIGYCWLLKGLIGSFGLLLGSLSIGFGTKLKTETEVALELSFATRRKLFGFYRAHRDSGDAFHQAYLHAKEQLREISHQNSVLMQQITKAPFLSKEAREELFNHALCEYHKQLDALFEDFTLLKYVGKPSARPIVPLRSLPRNEKEGVFQAQGNH